MRPTSCRRARMTVWFLGTWSAKYSSNVAYAFIFIVEASFDPRTPNPALCARRLSCRDHGRSAVAFAGPGARLLSRAGGGTQPRSRTGRRPSHGPHKEQNLWLAPV